jgi:hypothetical protein
MCANLIKAFYAVFVRRKTMYLRTCGRSAKSNKLFRSAKFADLLTAHLWCYLKQERQIKGVRSANTFHKSHICGLIIFIRLAVFLQMCQCANLRNQTFCDCGFAIIFLRTENICKSENIGSNFTKYILVEETTFRTVLIQSCLMLRFSVSL